MGRKATSLVAAAAAALLLLAGLLAPLTPAGAEAHPPALVPLSGTTTRSFIDSSVTVTWVVSGATPWSGDWGPDGPLFDWVKTVGVPVTVDLSVTATNTSTETPHEHGIVVTEGSLPVLVDDVIAVPAGRSVTRAYTVSLSDGPSNFRVLNWADELLWARTTVRSPETPSDPPSSGSPTATPTATSATPSASATPTPTPTPTAGPPSVSAAPFTAIVTRERRAGSYPNTMTYPVTLDAVGTDDSGQAQVFADIYSNNLVVKEYLGGVMRPSGATSRIRLTEPPPGNGPFYICWWARDPQGNESDRKGACQWLSLEVPLSAVSNGCGSSEVGGGGWFGDLALWAQNYLGDERVYPGTSKAVRVRKACNVHDAGYAGVTVFDPVRDGYLDFRTWSRHRVDMLFRRDVRSLCKEAFADEPVKRWLRRCLEGYGEQKAADEYVAVLGTRDPLSGERRGPRDAFEVVAPFLGAQTYFEIVRNHGAPGYDADLTRRGIQSAMPTGPTDPVGGGRDPD